MGKWKPLAIWAGVAVIYTLLQTFVATIDYRNRGGVAYWKPVVWESTSIFTIFVLAIGVFFFVSAFPFTRRNWVRILPLHLLAAVIFSLAHTGIMNAMRYVIYWFVGQSYDGQMGMETLLYEGSKDLRTYVSLCFMTLVFLYLKGMRQAREQALSLEAEVADLKLRRLRDQLRPHFLFNTLNLISSTMYEDVDKADKLMADLSALLRQSLDQRDLDLVPLRDELHFLRLYLAIIEARFSGRLQTQFQVEPEVETAWVPRFLLQPLVENAVEHGFGGRQGQGRIWISARREGEHLLLCVCDNGRGISTTHREPDQIGLGLGNTQAILQHLFGDRFRLELGPNDGQGTRIDIVIPWQDGPRERHPRGDAA